MLNAIPLGLDSLLICVALGLLKAGRWSVWRCAALFGLFDGLALLLGTLMHEALVAGATKGEAFCVMVACAALALIAGGLAGGRWMGRYGVLLPLLFSADDFLAGMELTHPSAHALGAAARLAATSTALAFGGLWCGATLAQLLATCRSARIATARLGHQAFMRRARESS